MKRSRIVLSVCISILLLLSMAQPAVAAPVPEDAIQTINIFTVDGRSGKSIYSCSFEDPVWEFPSVYQGKSIYGIEALGPNRTTVEVIIPEGIEYLDNSFSGFSTLEKADLPSTLTHIYDYSFYECGVLSEITLPDGLLFVGDRAFSKCTALQSMTIPDSVTEIGQHAFSGCTALKQVKIGSGIRNISSYTFRDCNNLESVIFSDGLEVVGYEAFLNTSVRTVTLPGSIRQLGVRAFNFDKLEKIVYEGTKAEFEAVVNDAFEEYSDKIVVECTDGTIIYNDPNGKTPSEETPDLPSDPGNQGGSETTGGEETTDGPKDPGEGGAPVLGIIIITLAVLGAACVGTAVFLLIKRRNQS